MESRNRFVPVEINEYDKDFTGIKFAIESEPRRGGHRGYLDY